MMRVTLLALVLAQVPTAHARGPAVSAADYRLYMEYKDGREDPRLSGLSEEKKLVRIAESLGVKADELRGVVARLDPLAPTIAKESERAVTAAVAETPLSGRVLEMRVDAGQAHVVAGLKWRCGDARDLDKEAGYAAWAVADSASIVETLVLWCVDASDVKQFSAKIARSAFTKITREGIERFASTRYLKLFEAVKRGPHS